MTLQVELPAEQHDRFLKMAERLGVEPQELARIALTDVVNGPEDQFKRISDRIVEKDAELYRRSAQ